ncbi:MAG: beta-N-acetylhexosaminidase [Alphaproteobacteria bacterium]|nr:beta-N-acetylhexosaminidase [Alphaproteobacteria bacterium]MBU0797114.1 beta-N-acetylhexosaminidase [Alphaproteobacteria bacterium]MBU0887921.1 beta-N-acetylhexosaminidase [Alphaproteobacteria bacterium]MBU1814856.1 beta-N-acetylhexosaminidase [Alphaproteobacteria bacterium]
MSNPSAVIFGMAGLRLSEAERKLFQSSNPAGFILFQRNCDTPEQVAALTRELRDCIGRPDAPILIDQEGGRVQRLKPPHWRQAPPAGVFAALYETDPEAAMEGAYLNARLIAEELAELGINVDCAPVLDLLRPETHGIIGDRAYGSGLEPIAALGLSVANGLMAGGVLPVIKHIPGHGRATVDSHLELPIVDTPRAELEQSDFGAFAALSEAPFGMTAHVVYSAIDPAHPATISRVMIEEIIRKTIGFSGCLMSDDIGMKALGGDFASRTTACLDAGCDLILHCSGDLAEMEAVAGVIRPLDGMAARRFARAMRGLPEKTPFDRAQVLARLDSLIAA